MKRIIELSLNFFDFIKKKVGDVILHEKIFSESFQIFVNYETNLYSTYGHFSRANFDMPRRLVFNKFRIPLAISVRIQTRIFLFKV